MLPQSAGGAVDANMLVYGTQNVRVVDGSIFPYQPSAHPMGLTYAVAVHAAKILQGIKGSMGTYTEDPQRSNSSSNATAVFPAVAPTVTYDVRGSAVPASSAVAYTGGAERLAIGKQMWIICVAVIALGWSSLM